MFEVRWGQDQLVHNRWIVESKSAGKDTVTHNPMRLRRVRGRDNHRGEQPCSRPPRYWSLLSDATRPSIMREHDALMPDLSNASARPTQADARRFSS